jgi:MarR family transcriptional regulator for hemolysin
MRGMPPPARAPIGLHLARITRGVSRAFDDAMVAAGGSTPTWLILISLKTRQLGNQRQLAEAIGIRGATLTHHLNAMEDSGLVVRRRDPANRRIQQVELTEQGEAAFHAMRIAATAFDERLRRGISEEELDAFAHVLDKLHANATEGGGEDTPGMSDDVADVTALPD